jgi:hypothetical protein
VRLRRRDHPTDEKHGTSNARYIPRLWADGEAFSERIAFALLEGDVCEMSDKKIPSRLKVKFLHIPKTAGTSIRFFLSRFFLARHICPAVNYNQFQALSIEQLRSFRMFSGHFPWSALDKIEGPSFTFCVLRQPVARIISFYFFLRAVAARSDPLTLATPQMRGIDAAITLSPDAFFCDGGAPDLRRHIDDLFYNFYTFYFAGRSFNARGRLQAKGISDQEVLAKAHRNLDLLDGLYSTDDLAPLQEEIIASFGRHGIGRWGTLRSRLSPLPAMNLNHREGNLASRIAELRSLGATSRTFDRISEMTRLDSVIWTTRFGHIPLRHLD